MAKVEWKSRGIGLDWGRRWRRLIKINHKSSFLAAGVGWYEEAVLWSGPEFVDRFFYFI